MNLLNKLYSIKINKANMKNIVLFFVGRTCINGFEENELKKKVLSLQVKFFDFSKVPEYRCSPIGYCVGYSLFSRFFIQSFLGSSEKALDIRKKGSRIKDKNLINIILFFKIISLYNIS